jgi:hypothetical protein
MAKRKRTFIDWLFDMAVGASIGMAISDKIYDQHYKRSMRHWK